jgi:DNA-directed RNA polymerase specialized sigma subunit
MVNNEKKGYLSNKELCNEIIRCKENDKISNEAIQMFTLMSTRLSRKFSYIQEEDRQDCIQQAIIDCFLYFRGFDPEKSVNAFAYFTQVIKNAFAKEWRILYKDISSARKTRLNSKIWNF